MVTLRQFVRLFRPLVDAYREGCRRAGIPWSRFYAAVEDERGRGSSDKPGELFRRAWGKIGKVKE